MAPRRTEQKGKKSNPVCSYCEHEIKDKVLHYLEGTFCSQECIEDYKYMLEHVDDLI